MPESVAVFAAYAGILGIVMMTAFLLTWESGDPLVAFESRHAHWRHVLANYALLGIVMGLLWSDPFGALIGAVPFAQTLSDGWLDSAFRALPAPWLWQLAAALVVVDLAEYFWHRLRHRVPLLWRFHRVHHSDPHLDVSTAVRFHPLESIAGMALGMTVLALCGLPLWIEALRLALANPVAFLQHANVRFPPWWERALRNVLVTPAMHRIHHARDAACFDRNFSQVFPVWDRVFGTYRKPAEDFVPDAGLEGCDDRRWQSVFGMLAAPWRKS